MVGPHRNDLHNALASRATAGGLDWTHSEPPHRRLIAGENHLIRPGDREWTDRRRANCTPSGRASADAAARGYLSTEQGRPTELTHELARRASSPGAPAPDSPAPPPDHLGLPVANGQKTTLRRRPASLETGSSLRA
jgi:hypothetical protein